MRLHYLFLSVKVGIIFGRSRLVCDVTHRSSLLWLYVCVSVRECSLICFIRWLFRTRLSAVQNMIIIFLLCILFIRVSTHIHTHIRFSYKNSDLLFAHSRELFNWLCCVVVLNCYVNRLQNVSSCLLLLRVSSGRIMRRAKEWTWNTCA